MSILEHKTIYESSDRFELHLPLTDSLKAYHKDGSFPLVKDPTRQKKASMYDLSDTQMILSFGILIIAAIIIF